jgi:hypothetical protein
LQQLQHVVASDTARGRACEGPGSLHLDHQPEQHAAGSLPLDRQPEQHAAGSEAGTQGSLAAGVGSRFQRGVRAAGRRMAHWSAQGCHTTASRSGRRSLLRPLAQGAAAGRRTVRAAPEEDGAAAEEAVVLTYAPLPRSCGETSK